MSLGIPGIAMDGTACQDSTDIYPGSLCQMGAVTCEKEGFRFCAVDHIGRGTGGPACPCGDAIANVKKICAKINVCIQRPSLTVCSFDGPCPPGRDDLRPLSCMGTVTDNKVIMLHLPPFPAESPYL